MENVQADRAACISSHHYPLIADLFSDILRTRKKICRHLDVKSLRAGGIWSGFNKLVCKEAAVEHVSASLNKHAESFGTWLHTTVGHALKEVTIAKKQPWISEGTLGLIHKRHQARLDGQ